jgi:hypothetical protein
MIGGITRRFPKSLTKDPWDADQEFEPESELEAEPDSQMDSENLDEFHTAPTFQGTNVLNTSDYYKSIVLTAIANEGKYGEHQMSIPWLRMILAGLEWKRIDPETMWYGAEATGLDGPQGEGMPSYDDLFHSDDAGSRLR